MSKSILLFSSTPGGANTIIPLLKPLQKKGYKVEVYGNDISVERYKKFDIDGKNIKNQIKKMTIEEIESFLINKKFDFIISGSGGLDMSERYLWKAADKLNIKSFAIIDQWIGYAVRFSKNYITDFDDNRTIDYLPTYILVIDEYSKKEAIKEGLDPSRLIVTGQPYFEFIAKRKKLSDVEKNNIKSKLGINDSSYLITFASETYIFDKVADYWGFSERSIFDELYNSITRLCDMYNKNVTIIIKIHPFKNDLPSFKDLINGFMSKNVNIIVDEDTNQWDLMEISDLISGMSSMFLIESVILDKPTISIQIGLKRENPFILDRRGIMKSILSSNELFCELEKIIIKESLTTYNFDVIKDPVKHVIENMEKILCQN